MLDNNGVAMSDENTKKPRRKCQLTKVGPLGKFNDVAREKIVEGIRSGMTIRLACACAGITTETFYYWKDKGRQGIAGYKEFNDDVGKAEMDSVSIHLENIAAAARKGSWQASAWILERRFPADFGK